MVNAALILFPPELTKYLDKSGIKGTSDLICEIIKLFTNFKSSSIRSIIMLEESLLLILLFLIQFLLFLNNKFCNFYPTD